jgi:hypothetical protein
VAVIVVAGCVPEAPVDPGFVCGSGTVAAGSECAAEVRCGPGTEKQGDRCVPTFKKRTCGPGTKEQDGLCVRVPPSPCPPSEAHRGDKCIPLPPQTLPLPFKAGTVVTVGQGPMSPFSHTGLDAHAVDFLVPPGTPVLAVRAGRVLRAKQDSATGCVQETCKDDANLLWIDHGDGTIARYLHLQKDGVDVAVGASVCTGQIVARSGNTGWSTGPHLHLAVHDLLGQSLPLRFTQSNHAVGTMAYTGQALASETNAVHACAGAPVAWSTCLPGTFEHLGVLLEPPLPPCTRAAMDTAIPVKGRLVLVPGANSGAKGVAVGRMRSTDNTWQFSCMAADATGTFAGQFAWQQKDGHGGSSFVVFAATDAQCKTLGAWTSASWVALTGP